MAPESQPKALIQSQGRPAPLRARGCTACPAIRAVTFDVGGTLIHCWPSVGHLYAQAAERHGYRGLSPAVLNRNFKKAWQAFKRFSHSRADWAALVDATFQGLVDPPPSQSFFSELYDRFAQPDAWHIFNDVLPILNALKSRGLALGIISNWDDRLRPLLRRLKLDTYFDAIVVSSEVGAQKPAGTIFQTACLGLGAAPGQTLHVGDSRQMDWLGARNAGLQARWLRRGTVSRPAECIGSLRELDKI